MNEPAGPNADPHCKIAAQKKENRNETGSPNELVQILRTDRLSHFGLAYFAPPCNYQLLGHLCCVAGKVRPQSRANKQGTSDCPEISHVSAARDRSGLHSIIHRNLFLFVLFLGRIFCRIFLIIDRKFFRSLLAANYVSVLGWFDGLRNNMIGNVRRILLQLDFTIGIGMAIRQCRIASADVIGRRVKAVAKTYTGTAGIALLRFLPFRIFAIYLQFGMTKRSNIMATSDKFIVGSGVHYARTLWVTGAVPHKDNLIAESRQRIVICHKDSSSPLSSKPCH
mmetsp:Transcript_304/g.846  ORF Transcript_304/g.846 Transcript_304/m.846 type:complete len:281 (-) Transcript_304:1498-2340(-)